MHNHDLLSTLKAPDFPTGGLILYNRDELEKIYRTGRGSVRVRSVYQYDKANNCIDITQIPPTTTVEAIMDKTIDLIKAGKVREISDMRDETDLSGLKLTIDLKRGVDPEKLMVKLFRMTPLEDSFSCNFNILIGGTPMVLGVDRLIEEWVAFRLECIKRRLYFDLNKKKDKLHLLLGLAKILLDIDKAIHIVRETEEEDEVVPNLMIGFGIDKIQAEYVAEIKLRHLNREYILKRTQETDALKAEIALLEQTLSDQEKVKKIIVDELNNVIKKYGKARKSQIIQDDLQEQELEIEEAPDYPVTLFFTKEGYFKKITPQSLRMSSEHKLKEGDVVAQEMEASNRANLLFFTDRCQVYKARASDFDDTKASVLGEYIPAKLGMEEGESALYMAVTADYQGFMLFAFENGKIAKVQLDSYATKTNRKKLLTAYSDKSPVIGICCMRADEKLLLTATTGRMLLVDTAAIAIKATKNTQGVQVMTLKKNIRLASIRQYREGMLDNPHRYQTKSLPAAGMLPRAEDLGEQLKLS